MPKLRVFELAQELKISNKVVIDFLKEKDVEVKSHMSTLEEKEQKMVRDSFSGNDENKDADKKSVKKKSNLIQVHRPQNAMTQEGKNFRKNNNKPAQGRPQSADAAKDVVVKDNTAKENPVKDNTQNRSGASLEGRKFNNNRQNQGQSQDRPERRTDKREDRNQDRPDRRDDRREDRREGSKDGQNNRRFDGNKTQDRPQRKAQGQSQDRPERREDRRDDRVQDRPDRRDDRREDRREGSKDGQSNRRFNNERSNDRFNDRSNSQNQQEGRKFDNNRNNNVKRDNRDNRDLMMDKDKDSDYKEGRENNRRSERRDSKSSSMESMDLGLARKPVRDVKSKEKDREKEREREEKKTMDMDDDGSRQSQGRRPNQKLPKALQKPVRPQQKEEKKEEVKEIILPEKLTIRELADAMKMQPSVIVKKLFMEGVMVTVNQEIEFEKAQEIAMEYNIVAEMEEKVDVIEELLREEEEDEDTMITRPPVVCVMGHVDHGKTSLLDAIRKTNVTSREAGGITQHIGAYVASINGEDITFLDTPGHEAFTAMRMRGANATDIAVLVVAADDGVMPQTIEAINHAKAAGVEIIVAINKIDKPSANIDRVKKELTEYELVSEDWGGSTVFVPVSAKTGEGISDLLEMILLTSEVCELRANPNRRARGLVIEAELDKGKGPVATILVQKGTLHVGDFIAAGACSGKVRAMMDDKGRRVKEAGPSMPVEILGLSDVPHAGEVLVATENDKEAKEFAETFIAENKNRLLEETKSKMSLDDLFNQIQEGNLKELNLIVKADVQGSVEAVKQSLVKLSNDEVVVKVIHGGVGAINESDVTLASASNAIIIGFNVRPDATAKAIADQEGVDLRLYRVIYQAIEDVEAAMKGMLDPIFEEKIIGHGEVRQIFKASGVGNIAGSYVMDGTFQRNCKVRISREGTQIYEGSLASLKRFKDDVKEVRAGYECGLVFDGFNDIQEFDQVEAYIMVEVPR